MDGILEQLVLWRRLETPGHDACGLWSFESGWRLVGAALFLSEDQPCHLRYEVECSRDWHTRWATVHGLVGAKPVSLTIEARSGRRWRFNKIEQPEVSGLVDVDLGFTPATNLIQLRRLALAVGQASDAPVSYLRFPELTLGRMEQWYGRTDIDQYDYRSPYFGYSATLHVSNKGFVTHYPDLFELEALR
jgi:hypothetical protein